MIAGYAHGSAAVTEATTAALAKVADPSSMLLVEGVSDQIAVETLAGRRGHELADHRTVVVPVGGAGGIGRVLAEHTTATQRLVALCDASEAALVRRAIAASGRTVSLFVCDPDLEAELVDAVGVDTALAVVDAQGDLGSFRTLQQQDHWRDRPAAAQLHRFIGAGARRKLRYARLLTDAAFDQDRVPYPLLESLAAAAGG